MLKQNKSNSFIFSFTGVFQKVAGKFGHIDIVCNNAGIVNENDWEKAIAINLV